MFLDSIDGIMYSLYGILIKVHFGHVIKLVLYFTVVPFEVFATVVDCFVKQVIWYRQVILSLDSSDELAYRFIPVSAVSSYVRCVDVTVGHCLRWNLIALVQ